MEECTQILNIPICCEVGYTPITRAKISELPLGRIESNRHRSYKSKLKEHLKGENIRKSYFEHTDSSFYEFVLRTTIKLDEEQYLHITESSSSATIGLNWYIDLYHKGVRILHIQSDYVEVRIIDPYADCVFSIQNGIFLSQEIGQFVRFTKVGLGAEQTQFKNNDFFNRLGYQILVYNTADCPPVYFNKGVLSAVDKEEAMEYIDSMLHNLMAAKQSILETNIISNAAVKEYCKGFANLIKPEDVLFKGF